MFLIVLLADILSESFVKQFIPPEQELPAIDAASGLQGTASASEAPETDPLAEKYLPSHPSEAPQASRNTDPRGNHKMSHNRSSVVTNSPANSAAQLPPSTLSPSTLSPFHTAAPYQGNALKKTTLAKIASRSIQILRLEKQNLTEKLVAKSNEYERLQQQSVC